MVGKGDGCDIISGLEESVNCDWNGDVDLGDGQLQALYEMYMDRLKRVRNLQLNIHVRNQRNLILESLVCEERSLPQDITFITNGEITILYAMYLKYVLALQSANEVYYKKLTESHTDSVLMNLAWNVDELSRLNQEGRKLLGEVSVVKQKLHESDLVSNNVTRQVTRLQENLITFLKGMYMQLK